MSLKTFVFSLGIVLFACAEATTYYWKPTYTSAEFDDSKGYGLWSDISNWSTESETGESAASLPGKDDTIYGLGNPPYNTWVAEDNKWRQFDLCKGEWFIGGWSKSDSDWDRHNWRFKNGTIHWTGKYSTHSDTVHLDEGASFIFDEGAKYTPSTGHAASDEWRVHSGAFLSVLCELNIYNINIEIDEGASVLFNPSKMYFASTKQHSYLQNNGTLSLPNGILFSRGTYDVHKFELRQLGGELIVGGPVTKNGQIGQYSITIGGGTVKATSDVYVDFEEALVTGSFELETAEGTLFDLSNFTFAPGVTLTKRGAGDIALSARNMPGSLVVHEGGLVLALSDVPHNLSGVVFGDGAKVKVPDGFLPVSGATVVTCSNAEVLAKVMGDLNTALSDAGIKLVVSGDSLVAESAFVFTSKGRWSDSANWEGGTIPSFSAAAYVRGEGTELLLDNSMIVMPAGIVVEDGATLKVTASVTMPPLTLAPTARLEIGDNGTQPETIVRFDSDPATSYRISGDSVAVPLFNVATNATIAFSYRRARLKNMDMTLCGLATTTDKLVGNITFGYAADGETSYFGLYADGATIHPLTYSWDSGVDFGANYVWPDVGGRVVQLRPYRFVECVFPCNAWSDFADSSFGVNNPVDEPCEFIFEKTSYHNTYRMFAGSTAKFRFIDGSTLSPGKSADHISNHKSQLNDWACIELDGALSYLSSFGEAPFFVFQPAVAGHETVILKNGASIKGFALDGNGNAALAVHEGEWSIPKMYRRPESLSLREPIPVLAGFGSAIVKDGGVFSIVGRSEGSSGTGSWEDWDRNLAVASPIAGAGNVVVSNAVESNSMAITMTSAVNTCTGRISCNVDNNCRLFFSDGAAWAGEVVAGGVALTNLTEDAASTVSFGSLDLTGDFPIRVWKSESGVVTNDMLNVGMYLNNGGALVPELMEGAEEDSIFGSIIVGKIGKNSALPQVSSRWIAKTQPIDGEESFDLLCIKRFDGFRLIVR